MGGRMDGGREGDRDKDEGKGKRREVIEQSTRGIESRWREKRWMTQRPQRFNGGKTSNSIEFNLFYTTPISQITNLP